VPEYDSLFILYADKHINRCSWVCCLYYEWQEITYPYTPPFFLIHNNNYTYVYRIFFHCPFLLLTILFTLLVTYYNRTSYNHTFYNHTKPFCTAYSYPCGPGSVVGIATGYGLDGPGIESRWGTRFYPPVQTGPRAHLASCTMDIGSFPG
jgi:hypothetical protein